jgi:hypothetical protein
VHPTERVYMLVNDYIVKDVIPQFWLIEYPNKVCSLYILMHARYHTINSYIRASLMPPIIMHNIWLQSGTQFTRQV